MPLPAPACTGAHCLPPGCSFSPHPAGVQGQVSVASPMYLPLGVWGETTGRSFSPGCNGAQKMNECMEAVVV